METFNLNGVPYVNTNDIPVIGDLMMLDSGNVVQANSIAHIEVLVDSGAKVIKPKSKLKYIQ